jgi:hypothetical protein
MALTLLAATATSARAVDLCWDYSNGGSMVAKDFRPPAKDKCKPFIGVERTSQGAGFSGMACTSDSGYNMIVHYTLHSGSWNQNVKYFEAGTCRVLLPIGPNSEHAQCYGSYSSAPDSVGKFYQHARFYFCDSPVPY